MDGTHRELEMANGAQEGPFPSSSSCIVPEVHVLRRAAPLPSPPCAAFGAGPGTRTAAGREDGGQRAGGTRPHVALPAGNLRPGSGGRRCGDIIPEPVR